MGLFETLLVIELEPLLTSRPTCPLAKLDCVALLALLFAVEPTLEPADLTALDIPFEREDETLLLGVGFGAGFGVDVDVDVDGVGVVRVGGVLV